MADGKITVTLKGAKDFDAPWVVLSADTAGEMRDRIGEVEQSGLLVDVGRVADAFKGYAAVGGTLGARPTNAPGTVQPNTPQEAPQGAQGGQQTNPGWGAPQGGNGQQSAPQGGQPQGDGNGMFTVSDNFGNTWEYNVPGAPETPRGPAIIKVGTKKGGGEWRKWYDPAAGPKWFTDRNPKVATGDRWQGGFVD